jgi:hypothetical protein
VILGKHRIAIERFQRLDHYREMSRGATAIAKKLSGLIWVNEGAVGF